MSQNDGTNTISFHYNDNMPVGFTLNDTKYIYLTNLQGDVVGIADTQGNVLARYSYDEWGKLLSINATSDDNYALAEMNPLRYRGYYYDNETGYYYLQSRYYNPEWCRFISYDDLDYVSADTPMSTNPFAYCINNPLRYTDSTGHDISADFVAKLMISIITLDFLSPGSRYIPKNKSTNSQQSQKTTIFNADNLTKTVAVVINEIFVCFDLQKIASYLNKELNFNSFSDYMDKKVELYREAFDKGAVKFWTSANDSANKGAGWISTLSGFFDKVLSRNTTRALSSLPYLAFTVDDLSGRYASTIGSVIMILYDTLINLIIDGGSAIISSVGSIFTGAFSSIGFSKYVDLLGTRNKAEYIAYNWYFLLFLKGDD